MSEYFAYTQQEIEHLRSRDPQLAAAIDTIGPVRREVVPDLFEALVHSIIGQQISAKAHITIWNRIKEGLGAVTPQAILTLSPQEPQAFGISMRKTEYIRNAAAQVENGTLDIGALQAMSDAQVCEQLCELKGIGIWTAEMLMIFSMQRRDILSYGDLGIHRGMRMLYKHKEITPVRFERLRKRYSPCGSVAGLYLWAVSAGAIEGLEDPAPSKQAAAKKSKKTTQRMD